MSTILNEILFTQIAFFNKLMDSYEKHLLQNTRKLTDYLLAHCYLQEDDQT